jgi:carbamoylphosphate synthase large subunit
MSFRPKILLIALETQWVSPARLPRALQAAGFEVGVACREQALLARARHRDHFFLLPQKNHARALLAGIRTIISAWKPDLILPLDDRTTLFLSSIPERLASDADSADLAALLRRSLGNPLSTREALSKRRTMEVARALGIRVPASQTVEAMAEIQKFAQEHGYPLVIKQSFGNSGSGVFICHNEAEARVAFEHVRKESKVKMRLLNWRERFRGRIMEASWLPADRSITVSKFIRGKCANSLAAAIGGRMLAALTVEVEQTNHDDTGPASVIQVTQNEEMRRFSEKMLNHWGLTGLIGFDFILDESRQAWLLECNPRPTSLGHLGALVGEDLCAALYQGLISMPVTRAGAVKELMIAFFPQESWRASDSPYFKLAFHDVPADDPDLLEALKNCPPHWRT